MTPASAALPTGSPRPATDGAQGASDSMGPVKAHERIVTLDILRGIALLGVLIANVWFWFNGLHFLFPDYQEELRVLSLDSVVHHGINLLVNGKAITTFSFLFGLGFAIQMLRAEEKGVHFPSFFRRRLLVLLLFGVVHAFFLWYGDILTAYALVGFVLILFRKRMDRTLAIWAGILLVGIPALMGALVWMAGGGAGGDEAAQAAQNAAALEAFRSGSFGVVMEENLRMLAWFWGGKRLLFLPTVLGIFIVGLLVGRKRVFENVEGHRPAFRRVRNWGLGLGLAMSAGLVLLQILVPFEFWEANAWTALPGSVLHFSSLLVLAAGYMATVTLLVHERAAWKRRLSIFAPVGRMALTNYLAQSVLCLLIFYGYGLGLIAHVGPAAALAISLGVFAVQIVWSHWWLARFRFGPMEWVWRVLTYGKVQPMRIAVPGAPAAPAPNR
jgi:uncharacterized protein